MLKRNIIKIDEEKCNGCGLCIPNCPEGAIQIIDAKARLISDLFCDGLGACIGHCPEGAISIEERQAQEYDETKVMDNIVTQGRNVIRAHLEHLKQHSQHEYLMQAINYLKEKGIEIPQFVHQAQKDKSGCPGLKTMDFRKEKVYPKKKKDATKAESELRQWPIQLKLIPASAPYLKDAHLLIAADCAAFAYADFHQEFLKGKVLLLGCPKLDDSEFYKEKISQILKDNAIKSITCVHMEVPCCFGMVNIVKSAISASGKTVTFKEVTISIKGEILK